jgi:hypothetical protein
VFLGEVVDALQLHEQLLLDKDIREVVTDAPLLSDLSDALQDVNHTHAAATHHVAEPDARVRHLAFAGLAA